MKTPMSEVSKKAQNITEWLGEIRRVRNADGFLIDFGNSSSVPQALALVLARRTLYVCCALVDPADWNSDFAKDRGTAHWMATKKNDFDWASRLASIAEEQNLLVVNPINIAERLFVRPWPHFTLIADMFPFGSMTKNEIEEMFAVVTDLDNPDYKTIYGTRSQDDQPYSDKFELTHADLQWALQANVRYGGIIDNQQDPTRHPKWFSLSIQQKKVIALLHQHAKLTAHKLTTTAQCFP